MDTSTHAKKSINIRTWVCWIAAKSSLAIFHANNQWVGFFQKQWPPIISITHLLKFFLIPWTVFSLSLVLFLAYNPSVHLLLTSELCFSHLKYIVYDLLDLGFHYYFYRNSVHLNQTITYLLYVCSLSVHSLSWKLTVAILQLDIWIWLFFFLSEIRLPFSLLLDIVLGTRE